MNRWLTDSRPVADMPIDVDVIRHILDKLDKQNDFRRVTLGRMAKPIRVICVDDKSDLTRLLQTWINIQPDMRCAHTFDSANALIDFLTIKPTERPDVVLLDWSMPGLRAVDAIEHVTRQWPFVRVVVYSAFLREDIERVAASAGATGFISKTAEVSRVLDAIRTAASGEYVTA